MSKSISRRQKFIEVGMDLFSHHPYEEVAIDDIAAAADISKGLLYYYFPTKHNFYAAVVQYAAEQLLAETKADPTLPPLERLRSGLNAYFSYAQRHARAYTALLRGVGGDEEIATIVDTVRQTFAQRIFESLSQDMPHTPVSRIAVRGWIGFVEAASIDWLEEHDISQEELCSLTITAFLALVQGNVTHVSHINGGQAEHA